LPPQLADDRYLRIEAMDSAPSDVEVIDLKAERVQEEAVAPAAAAAPASDSSKPKRG
jgi:hypothetical protein